ncbi:MAG: ABC transporter permease [Candidatus Methanoperedens sp.]|nr:ABC transporter permease [Candidatus Methanoperedens sp.]MCZ7395117.1 ABC transporter permease [Candidatus Methanoperedens sp.]
MKKYMLIAKHEFMTQIKRKEFILMTLGIPLFILIISTIPVLFFGIEGLKGEEVKVGYINKISTFQSSNFTEYQDESSAKLALENGAITHFFIIPADYLNTGKIYIYSTKKTSPASTTKVEEKIRDFLIDNLLKGQPENIIQRVKQPINSEIFTIDKNEESKEGFGTFIIPLGFALLFIIAIFSSSGFLLQGIVEEKENRVIEILLSSVSHRDLFIGKILGLGALGLSQLLIWLLCGIALLSASLPFIAGFLGGIKLSLMVVVLAPIYFILGYLVFASIMAGVGAISTSSQEGQQLAGIFSITGMIPIFFLMFIVDTPNNLFSRFLSFFPLTSSVTMILRLSISEVPVSDIVISLIILIAAVIGIIELSSRIFRATLLMYGKKPTLKEVIKYVREN